MGMHTHSTELHHISMNRKRSIGSYRSHEINQWSFDQTRCRSNRIRKQLKHKRLRATTSTLSHSRTCTLVPLLSIPHTFAHYRLTMMPSLLRPFSRFRRRPLFFLRTSSPAPQQPHLLACCLPPPLLLLLLPILVSAHCLVTTSTAINSSTESPTPSCARAALSCFAFSITRHPPSPRPPSMLSRSSLPLFPLSFQRRSNLVRAYGESKGSRNDGSDGGSAALQRAPRLYVPDALLRPGAPISLSSDQLHYLRNVMRLRAGAAVRAFNEMDGEWACALVSSSDGIGGEGGKGGRVKKNRSGGGGGTLSVVAQERMRKGGEEGREPPLRLCFAPLKKARMKTLFEKATELGVTHLQPVLTEYTDVVETHTEGVLGKMEGGLVEAAEQCERMSIPQILPPVTFAALIEEEEEKIGGRLYICRERAGARPIWEVLEEEKEEEEEEGNGGEGMNGVPSFLIGPEGGFSPKELKAMEGRMRLVSLGPSVLRAETAGVVALGVYVAWREGKRAKKEGKGGTIPVE